MAIGGEPAFSTRLTDDIRTFMGATETSVLMAYADPDVLAPLQSLPNYTGLIADLETAFGGQRLHFIQENQRGALGRLLDDWMRRI